jgi:hypothetical protein
MLSPSPTIHGPPIQQSSDRHEPRDLPTLAAESHREDVQERIRTEIHAGTVRVRPWPGKPDRVEVISEQIDDNGKPPCTRRPDGLI